MLARGLPRRCLSSRRKQIDELFEKTAKVPGAQCTVTRTAREDVKVVGSRKLSFHGVGTVSTVSTTVSDLWRNAEDTYRYCTFFTLFPMTLAADPDRRGSCMAGI